MGIDLKIYVVTRDLLGGLDSRLASVIETVIAQLLRGSHHPEKYDWNFFLRFGEEKTEGLELTINGLTLNS